MRVIPTTVVQGRKRPAREAFPERLGKARRAAGFSAVALSKAAGLGRGSVGLMESGHRLPRVGTVARLAVVLQVSPALLAFGDRRELAGELNTDDLAARVKSARDACGITLYEMGRLAGSSYAQAQALERGIDPTIEMVERFSVALDVSPSWFGFGLGDRELPRRGSRPVAAAAEQRTD